MADEDEKKKANIRELAKRVVERSNSGTRPHYDDSYRPVENQRTERDILLSIERHLSDIAAILFREMQGRR